MPRAPCSKAGGQDLPHREPGPSPSLVWFPLAQLLPISMATRGVTWMWSHAMPWSPTCVWAPGYQGCLVPVRCAVMLLLLLQSLGRCSWGPGEEMGEVELPPFLQSMESCKNG